MKKIIFIICMLGILSITSGCMFTATVIFTNWDGSEYTCLVDGVDYGLVAALGRLPVPGIPLGGHLLAAQGTATYSTYRSITFGENNWDFNKP